VIFASIDKDFESCTNQYVLGWAAVSGATYTGGAFGSQHNGGDESKWTTAAWSTIGIDLAFKAHLS